LLPASGAYEHSRHSSHVSADLLPGMRLDLPTGHARHAFWLDVPTNGLYVPAGHGVKASSATSAPASAQKPPAGQDVHVPAPLRSLYEPAAQAVQLVPPLTALYAPGGQPKQLKLPLEGE